MSTTDTTIKTTSSKTAELTGAALRYAVCLALGCVIKRDARAPAPEMFWVERPEGSKGYVDFNAQCQHVEYDTDWSQGGPIIEGEMEEVHREKSGWWFANKRHAETGPTLLVAGLRCFVASRLGDQVDVPLELAP
jgi:hypothetical protein